eukprot:1134660-Amphidinium_carterae.2
MHILTELREAAMHLSSLQTLIARASICAYSETMMCPCCKSHKPSNHWMVCGEFLLVSMVHLVLENSDLFL